MTIQAPAGKRFEVKILQHDIVRSPGCEKDYLQIFDGPDARSDVLPGKMTSVF